MNKKLVSTFIALTILTSMAATGCSNKNNQKETTQSTTPIEYNEPGTFPIVKEKQEISIVAPDTAYILDLNTNDFTKWFEEKTNIKVNYEQIPEESFKEKKNLMLATGNLPDAFMMGGFSKEDEVNYGQQGIIIPLNDLIEKYGYYTKQVFEQQEQLPAAVTAPDGNIYSLPHINECYHCMYSGKAWINQDWLDKLGLKYPETTDELVEVLRAFKTQDPNGNGKQDEVGIIGSTDGWNANPIDFLMNSFVYNDYGKRLGVKDGKIYFSPLTDEWREGLKFVNELMEEGLIEATSLTQPMQEMTALANSEDPVIGVGIGATPNDTIGSEALGRFKMYQPLSPLEGPNGVRTTITSPGGIYSGHFVITSAAKNPELIFKWVDSLYNPEVTMCSNYGIEGQEWEVAPEGYVGLDGNPAKWAKILKPETTGEKNTAMPNVALVNLTADVRAGEAIDPNDEMAPYKGEAMLFSATRDYYEPYAQEEYLPSSMYMLPEELDGFAQLQTQILDYVKESMGAFATGTRDINDDAEWEKYKKELEALNVARYLEVHQAAFDRTK